MRSSNKYNYLVLLCSVLMMALTGCGGDSGESGESGSVSNENSSSFTGTVGAGDGSAGVVTVSFPTTPSMAVIEPDADFATDSAATVSGTLIFAGDTEVSLIGSYDSSTGVLDLSDNSYSFSGTADSGEISGTFTGPDSLTGNFTGLDSTENTVTTFCGTFTGNDSGVWAMQVSSDGSASGSATNTSGNAIGHGVILSGTVSGTTFDIISNENVHAVGTISGDTVNGSFTDLEGNPVSFSGTAVGCQ